VYVRGGGPKHSQVAILLSGHTQSKWPKDFQTVPTTREFKRRGLVHARRHALWIKSKGVWEHTAKGRWGFTTSYTEKEALEAGKITQDWLDNLNQGKGRRKGVTEGGLLYYPAHLIKINCQEVERILAGGEPSLSPLRRAEREPKLE